MALAGWSCSSVGNPGSGVAYSFSWGTVWLVLCFGLSDNFSTCIHNFVQFLFPRKRFCTHEIHADNLFLPGGFSKVGLHQRTFIILCNWSSTNVKCECLCLFSVLYFCLYWSFSSLIASVYALALLNTYPNEKSFSIVWSYALLYYSESEYMNNQQRACYLFCYV